MSNPFKSTKKNSKDKISLREVKKTYRPYRYDQYMDYRPYRHDHGSNSNNSTDERRSDSKRFSSIGAKFDKFGNRLKTQQSSESRSGFKNFAEITNFRRGDLRSKIGYETSRPRNFGRNQ